MYIFGMTGITGISKQKEVLNGNSVRIVHLAGVEPEGSFYKLMAFFAFCLFCFHFLQLGVCKK